MKFDIRVGSYFLAVRTQSPCVREYVETLRELAEVVSANMLTVVTSTYLVQQ
jgi:hypothetical protein